jgi:hypothetical protein
VDFPECFASVYTLATTEEMNVTTEKRPSERQQIAERIAKYIRKNRWTAPFGGDVNKDGNAYSILFAKPAILDGLVRIWGPKFIVIQCQGKLSHGNWQGCYESEKDAMDFLRLAFVEYKWAEATEVPTRKFKERQPPTGSLAAAFREGS